MPKDIMVLSGYGLDIRVNGGHLKIKDGSTFEGNVSEILVNRGTNEIEHIVILGQTGNISFEAIKWIIDQKMMVTMIDPNGNVITNLMPETHVAGTTKRRQATADDSLNLKIAAWLLTEKFRGQRETLFWLNDTFKRTDWWNADRGKRFQEAINISNERVEHLVDCVNVDSMRILEAQTAAAYWHCYEGIPIKWSKPFKVPLHWLTIGNRVSPKTKSTRKAIDPFHAALNYLYTVLETKTRQTCFIYNIDPDFGVIHADRGNRASLIYDLMEPIRPKVDRLLFNWIYEITFNPKDFFETREGVCRISQDIISEIVPMVNKLDSDINTVVKQFAAYFKNKIVTQKPEYAVERQEQKTNKKSKPTVGQIALPFDSNEKIQPINHKHTDVVEVSKIADDGFIRCLECGIQIKPKTATQKFCSNKHRSTYHMRLKRDERINDGLCPMCGKSMPVAAAGTMKERLSYCEDCRNYWKDLNRAKKDRAFV